MFVFALHSSLSVYPFLYEDDWKTSMERTLILFSWFAMVEVVSEIVLLWYLKKMDLEKKLRIIACILLGLGWLASMVGSVRMHVQLVRNWSVEGKNEFLAWNWARVAFWGLRCGLVLPLTFWKQKDYIKVKQEPQEPYNPAKDDTVFTIDEYDEQLQDV